jgi:hypothetical protein
MGMFDWYKPRPQVKCPRCDSTLAGWQGKSGPCGLFEWVQGVASPARQLVDDDCAATVEVREATRLPDDFRIYTFCNPCQTLVEALGSCERGVWIRVDLLHPLESPGLPEEWMPLRGDDGHHTLAELRREIPNGHVLADRKLFPVARHRGRDDVLLRTIGPDAQLWLVHLTWRPETDPLWPRARPFRTVAEFVAEQDLG